MRTVLVVACFALGLGAIAGCSDSNPPVNTNPANEVNNLLPGGQPKQAPPGTDHKGPGKGRIPPPK